MQNSSDKKYFQKRLLFIPGIIVLFLIPVVILTMMSRSNDSENNVQIIQYNDFVTKIENGQIEEIEEEDEFLTSVVKKDNSEVIYKAKKITDRAGEDSNLMNIIEAENVSFKIQQPVGPNYLRPLLFNIFLFIVLPGIFIIGIVIIIVVVCSLCENKK